MDIFNFSGVYLKITPEIKKLMLKNFVNRDNLDEDEVIEEMIGDIGGLLFDSSRHAGRKTPISIEGKIDWSKSEVMSDFEYCQSEHTEIEEAYLYISFYSTDNDLRIPWLKENETLLTKIMNDESFDFIPKDYIFETKLEFYWIDACSID